MSNEKLMKALYGKNSPTEIGEVYHIARWDTEDIEFSDDGNVELFEGDAISLTKVYDRMVYFECEDFVDLLLYLNGVWYNIEQIPDEDEMSFRVLDKVKHTTWAEDLNSMELEINTGSLYIEPRDPE